MYALRMKRTLSPLTLGIAVPFITLALLAVSIFLPRYFITPKYDFIYSGSGTSMAMGSYVMNGNEISYQDYGVAGELSPIATTKPKLFRYHLATDRSEEISMEDANKLGLSADYKSPDGFTYSINYGDRMLSLFASSYNQKSTVSIEGHGVQKKLDITSAGYSSPQFLAWIVK